MNFVVGTVLLLGSILIGYVGVNLFLGYFRQLAKEQNNLTNDLGMYRDLPIIRKDLDTYVRDLDTGKIYAIYEVDLQLDETRQLAYDLYVDGEGNILEYETAGNMSLKAVGVNELPGDFLRDPWTSN